MAALVEYVRELERRLEVGTRRRHPMAEWPTALEITAAQEMIARFSGCEQLAAAYVAGRPAASANPGREKAAPPGTRSQQPWLPGRLIRLSSRPSATRPWLHAIQGWSMSFSSSTGGPHA
jgi:hypothetical protein